MLVGSHWQDYQVKLTITLLFCFVCVLNPTDTQALPPPLTSDIVTPDELFQAFSLRLRIVQAQKQIL